jgi:putative peptidoglycan lipid II flippase
VFALRVAVATVLLAATLAWAAHGLDWIALRAQPWQRAGAMALVLASVAALYFATLMATGLRLRAFLRRG